MQARQSGAQEATLRPLAARHVLTASEHQSGTPHMSDIQQTQRANLSMLAQTLDANGISPSMTINPNLRDWGADETLVVESRLETNFEELIDALPNIEWSARAQGDFILRDPLGQGGMGIVYLATQRSLGRDVAVKKVRPDRLTASSTRQLIHEAQLAGALDHPAILPVYSFGLDDQDQPILVMKRISGKSWLDELSAEGARSPSGQLPDAKLLDHLHILMEVCRAMEFAHARGILHRDLKPENVMLGEFGEVYVVDWGVAVHVDRQHKTAEGGYPIVGTPSYMSPEVALGMRCEPESDVFLLGACLHELLVDEPRHVGRSLMNVLVNAARCEPYDYPAYVTSELARIANRACHRDLSQRYASVAELREALDGYLEHRAAILLCDKAESRVAALAQATQGELSERSIELRSFQTEAQFAYKQALEIWPESPRAITGLARCLELGARHEIARANLDVAEHMLSELAEFPGVDPAVLSELRAALEEAREDASRLAKIARANDAGISSREKFGIAVTLVVSKILISVAALKLFSRADMASDGYGPAIILSWTSFISIGVAVGAFWKRIQWNSYNRRLIGSVMIAAGVAPSMRMMGWWMQIDQSKLLRVEMFMTTVLISMIALAFHMRSWWAVAIYAAILAFAAYTDYIVVPYNLALIIVIVAFGRSGFGFQRAQNVP